MLLDQADLSVHQIFFDDKIGELSGKILDSRHARTGETINFEEINNKFIFRVNPYLAITDSDYFFKAIVKCEHNRNELGREEEIDFLGEIRE